MSGRHHRAFRLLTSTVIAAALAATAAAGGNAVTKGSANDSKPDSSERHPPFRQFERHPAPCRKSGRCARRGRFDWTTAGVGAAGGVGLALVVGAGTFRLRHRQSVDAARA